MWFALVCSQYLQRADEFGSDFDNFGLFNKIEIWTKFFISPVLLKAQKRQTTFRKCKDQGYFVIMNFRIVLLKLSSQINAVHYFKARRRPSICLATIMFRGTPCIFTFFLLYNTALSDRLPCIAGLSLWTHFCLRNSCILFL